MGRLEGKNAIITGAGRGIGKAIARKFLAEGARILICDVVAERLNSTSQELSALGKVESMIGDLTDPAFCDALVAHAMESLGELNILANNAGIAIVQPFLETTQDIWERTLDVNVKAMYMLSQRAAKVMVAQGKGGAIVNMASTNGHVGERGLAAYNTSKGGVVMLTKTMAIELAKYGIRVNAVSPGFILTDLAREGGMDKAMIRDYIQKIPLGRYGRPEEVADLFAYLASDEASFITGASVIIDGGQLAEE